MRPCPYCGGTTRFVFAHFRRKYYRCLECDLCFHGRIPSQEQAIAFYQNSYYNVLAKHQKSGARSLIYDAILERLSCQLRGRRLLDVGTGVGFFLKAAREKGWAVSGLDPSIESVDFARHVNHLDVHLGTLMDYTVSGPFDAISFINVLDHSVAPWAELRRAAKLLAPSGVIMIRHPNGLLRGGIARLCRLMAISSFANRFTVFHEYSFTPRFIKRLLSDCGFMKIEVSNSLLSETISRHPGASPRGRNILRGLISIGSKIGSRLSGGHLLLGSSLDVMAQIRLPKSSECSENASAATADYEGKLYG